MDPWPIRSSVRSNRRTCATLKGLEAGSGVAGAGTPAFRTRRSSSISTVPLKLRFADLDLRRLMVEPLCESVHGLADQQPV